MTEKPNLDAAYGLDGEDANLKLYADWADSYDSSFAEGMDYILPMAVARDFVNGGGCGPVLDLGAGTGLCGAALKTLGVDVIDATDLSSDMLDIARGKAIYRDVFTGNLLEILPVQDGAYLGAVSSGTFTHGHVGPEALDEVYRIVAPGGIIALSINAEHWQAKGFEAKFDALSAQITNLSLTQTPIYGPEAKGRHAKDKSIIVRFQKL